jgi:MFS transporter, DHA3 family, macrolide efflux protein
MSPSAREKAQAHSASRHGSEHKETGWRLLKIPDLRWLWIGQAVSQIGEGLNKVALLYLVYNLTSSTLMMTVIGILETLPPLILGPLLGVYIDRFPKKWVMMGVDTLRAGLALIIPLLYGANALTLPAVYFVVFTMAVIGTVFGPALAATVPLVVQRTQLVPANALVGSTAMLAMLIGPALSGLGIATIGMQIVLYASSVTFVLSVLSLSRLHLTEAHHVRRSKHGEGFITELRQGLRFAFIENRSIGGLVGAALCYSLASSAFVFLLPVFTEKVLHVGAMMLGWLWSAYGAGMVIVSVTLASMTQQKRSTQLAIIAGAMVAGGLASFMLARTSNAVPSMGLVAVIGAGLASFTPIMWGLLQDMTPEHLRGRVFSIFNTGAMSASMLGMVAFGWGTDRLGPQVSLGAMAVIFWLTAVILVLLRQFAGLEHSKRGTA